MALFMITTKWGYSMDTRIKYVVSFYYSTSASYAKRNIFYGKHGCKPIFLTSSRLNQSHRIVIFFACFLGNWHCIGCQFEDLPDSKCKFYCEFFFFWNTQLSSENKIFYRFFFRNMQKIYSLEYYQIHVIPMNVRKKITSNF